MATEWTEVRSSNVKRVGWDDEAGELLIDFKSGAVYGYSSAGKSAYDDLAVHPSPGSYVARWLKQQPSRRIK